MIEFINGLLIGFIVGGIVVIAQRDKDFDGQYDKAKYEWKLNKEKQNDTTKN